MAGSTSHGRCFNRWRLSWVSNVHMLLRAAVLALFVCALGFPETLATSAETETETPAPAVCPAGGPIGSVDLEVGAPDSKGERLPLRTINHLGEGDIIYYSPVVRGREKRSGEVALVMLPRRRGSGDQLIVTDPLPADRPESWKVPEALSIVMYVYGPAGLSKKKVQGFLSQDDLLMAQLADYAEKTAQTEALIEALSSSDSSAASVNAALSGFASQYGTAMQMEKNAPPGVQASMLFNSLNPQLASYDPLQPSASAKIGQTASLTTAAAALFFGSPIGLAAGGTAMLLDLRSIAFPGTQFRSSFAQPIPNGLNLCGQRQPAPPHTRVAYLWANRIPNAAPPVIEVGKESYLPPDLKTVLPVTAPDATWKYLERARNWTLDDDAHHRFPVKLTKLANQKAVELDLTKTKVPPGTYQLAGYWDWDQFVVKGALSVRNLAALSNASPDPVSQDRLLAKSGKAVLTLMGHGEDFEFTSKVELKKDGDEFFTPVAIPFALPKGPRQGPQDRLDVQIDTTELQPGVYQVVIWQPDAKPHPVSIHVLPNPPALTNLPIIANQGAAEQHYVLQGERLNLLTTLQADGVQLTLAAPGTDNSQRNVTVQLNSSLAAGTVLPVKASVKDRSEPLQFPQGLRITGPLPTIASSKLSLPAAAPIALRAGEVPAGTTLTAVLDVKNATPASLLELRCAGDHDGAELRIGSQTEHASLQQLSTDQLFLSYDTTSLPTGCSVQAKIIDGSGGGESAPYSLAKVIRMPRIVQFTPSGDAAEGKRKYQLVGTNLEMIERVGWDELSWADVQDLPAPVPGQGQTQSLELLLPDPPEPRNACLYLWLRGDKMGRATTIAPSAPPPQTSAQH